MKVYYSVLLERYLPDIAVNALLDVAAYAGVYGAIRIETPYSRTDQKRQVICEKFMEVSNGADDVLVMLDNDHVHPKDIIGRLVRFPPEFGVVAALAYLRGKPYNPIFYTRINGNLHIAESFERVGLIKTTIAAPCAVAIRRWVLQKLRDAGEKSWWKYIYDDPQRPWWGEDMYFGELCEKYGIAHYVDLETVVPHLTHRQIGPEDWEREKEKDNEQ